MNDYPQGHRCEEEAARLLPWYVAGRLEAADAARVARHLERCTTCRDDFEHERTVRTLLKAESSVEYAPQAGLARTLARIDELEREAPAAIPAAGFAAEPSRRFSAVPWLAAAALVQAVALGILGTAMFHRSADASQEPRYATLSAEAQPPSAGEHIRAVFSPDVTIGALDALLASNALTIIRGPSDAGVYTLAFADAHGAVGRLDRAIATLRANSQVKFAEPAVNDEAGVR
jgi:anti-sigma factor RsiW